MSKQPPVRSKGVNNPENVTGTKKYFLRPRAHGDEESLHEESLTRSPSPSPDSGDDRITELEESIRQLKAKNARYHNQMAAKSSRASLLESSHTPRVEPCSSNRVILLKPSHAVRDASHSSSRALLLETSHFPRIELRSSSRALKLYARRASVRASRDDLLHQQRDQASCASAQ